MTSARTWTPCMKNGDVPPILTPPDTFEGGPSGSARKVTVNAGRQRPTCDANHGRP